jgi:hypothetical protein
MRKLVVEPKDNTTTGGFEVPLVHNSVVVFTTSTNQRYRHKIVLDRSGSGGGGSSKGKSESKRNCKSKQPLADNTWLGVTFRVSKTFVTYIPREHAHNQEQEHENEHEHEHKRGRDEEAAAAAAIAGGAGGAEGTEGVCDGEGAEGTSGATELKPAIKLWDAVFEDGTPLKLARQGGAGCGVGAGSDGTGSDGDGALFRQFRQLRAVENRTVGFRYPPGITFTISPSDLMPPV